MLTKTHAPFLFAGIVPQIPTFIPNIEVVTPLTVRSECQEFVLQDGITRHHRQASGPASIHRIKLLTAFPPTQSPQTKPLSPAKYFTPRHSYFVKSFTLFGLWR